MIISKAKPENFNQCG